MKTKDGQHSDWLVWVLVPMGILLLVFHSGSYITKHHTFERKFDSVLWKNADEQGKASMFNDLVDSKILIGKTSEQVTHLLGKPISTEEREGDREVWFYGIFYIRKLWNNNPFMESHKLIVSFHGQPKRVWAVSTDD